MSALTVDIHRDHQPEYALISGILQPAALVRFLRSLLAWSPLHPSAPVIVLLSEPALITPLTLRMANLTAERWAAEGRWIGFVPAPGVGNVTGPRFFDSVAQAAATAVRVVPAPGGGRRRPPEMAAVALREAAIRANRLNHASVQSSLGMTSTRE